MVVPEVGIDKVEIPSTRQEFLQRLLSTINDTSLPYDRNRNGGYALHAQRVPDISAIVALYDISAELRAPFAVDHGGREPFVRIDEIRQAVQKYTTLNLHFRLNNDNGYQFSDQKAQMRLLQGQYPEFIEAEAQVEEIYWFQCTGVSPQYHGSLVYVTAVHGQVALPAGQVYSYKVSSQIPLLTEKWRGAYSDDGIYQARRSLEKLLQSNM